MEPAIGSSACQACSQTTSKASDVGCLAATSSCPYSMYLYIGGCFRQCPNGLAANNVSMTCVEPSGAANCSSAMPFFAAYRLYDPNQFFNICLL